MICNARITGIPIRNLLCKVLCLQIFIPVNAPMLPPSTAIVSNVDSGIRHLSRFALYLSMPKAMNAAMLMARRYRMMVEMFVSIRVKFLLRTLHRVRFVETDMVRGVLLRVGIACRHFVSKSLHNI